MNLKIVVMRLACTDPVLLATFYSDVLGLPVLRKDEKYAVIDCGGVMLELTADVKRHEQELQFESGDIDRAVVTLESKGVIFDDFEIGMKPDGTVVKSHMGETFWGRYAAFHDPDGNRVIVADHDEELFPFMPAWYLPDIEKNRQTNG